jgi:hypothetical protein
MPQTTPEPATGTHPTSPIHPELEVRVRSLSPLVLVSAVRYALWKAGADADEIDAFTKAALTARSERQQRRICSRWVHVCS